MRPPFSLASWTIRLMGADSGLTTASTLSALTMLPNPILMSFNARTSYSTFCTCSRIFSISDLMSTTR